MIASLSRHQAFPILTGVLLLAAGAGPLRADAIVRTQAMLASTIAEYFVEDGRVLVELEIGPEDLAAFGNLMPDELYEQLGHEPRPWRQRLADFFEDDLAIQADGADPLPGHILEIGPRQRVRRDEISGEPLVDDGEPTETVVFARLEYPLRSAPDTLTLSAGIATSAGVGFVAYHGGIAVNDFRYLGTAQTLHLDRDDPWYTRFEARALRRVYHSPMSGFIYVEPYEVRKEIIARPKDLQRWIDLDLEGRTTIPVELQQQIKTRVAEFLRQHQPVEIDGRPVTAKLARINFLERTLRTSRVIDPPVELDLNAAVLGAIFVYPTDGLPQRVTMEWDLFDERIRRVSAAAVDPVGPLPSYLEPDDAVLEWENFIKIDVMPSLAEVRAPPTTLARWLLTLRWVFGAVTLLAVWLLLRAPPPRRALLGLTVAAVLLTGGAAWASREARLSDEASREVVGDLLHNVYRAFDFREERQIYDVLARSVQGELLRQIYLETRRGLELANQGGARAKVNQIELEQIRAVPAPDGGFLADATWTVAGSVGHWGHVHERRNRYQAELDVRPVDGAWKLTGLRIIQEQRL